jgi:hypothetical protein
MCDQTSLVCMTERIRLGTFSYPGLESFRATSQGSFRMVRTLVTDQLAEAWTILRRHSLGPEVAQQSVTPGFLTGAGGLA